MITGMTLDNLDPVNIITINYLASNSNRNTQTDIIIANGAMSYGIKYEILDIYIAVPKPCHNHMRFTLRISS